MMDEKKKAKVRKLLALAQSDNPHEAERARVQAEKMMAMHNLSLDGIEVKTVKAKSGFNRRKIKTSEAFLMEAIQSVSGCLGYLNTTIRKNRKGVNQFTTVPAFMGMSDDAEFAAFVWDVLYRQLKQSQREVKKLDNLTANEVEIYSMGWVESVVKKIEAVFESRKPSKAVQAEHEALLVGVATARTLSAKSTARPEKALSLLGQGTDAGKRVHLANAAPDLREPILSISAGRV